VGREEKDLLTGLDDTLLDTAGDDITHTLDLVDAGHGHSHGSVVLTGGKADHVVQGVHEGVDVEGGLVLLDEDVLTLPPGHLLGLLQQVVAHPAGDGEDGDALLDEVLLPAGLDEHGLHLLLDLGEAGLLVLGNVAVHLVDADHQLLDAQQVDQTGVLAGLALDLAGLVVATGDGGDEVTVGGDHQQGHVGLGGAGDHVLDEVSVPGGVDHGVVPLVGEELLGGAGDGDTSLTLLLLTVHVEREGEGLLAQTLGLLLQLLHLSLGDSAELEEETTGGGGLAGVDVTADHDGHMGLTVGGHFE